MVSKCRQCGVQLVWDDKVKSAGGKMIPLEKNGNKHQCPFSKFAKSTAKGLDIPPTELLQKHDREIADIKKRLDKLEIDQKWGSAKSEGSDVKPQTKDTIDWNAVKADQAKETTTDDKLEALKKL
jgi:glutaredoxin